CVSFLSHHTSTSEIYTLSYTTLFRSIQLVYFVHRLAQAALAPSLPNWRLIAVETPAAYMLVWLITLTALIIGFDFLLDSINELRSEEHTSELQSRENLVCRLLLEKKK